MREEESRVHLERADKSQTGANQIGQQAGEVSPGNTPEVVSIQGSPSPSGSVGFGFLELCNTGTIPETLESEVDQL